jgi:predicted  nucleic acid-binding Zn-ribbon protein
MYYDVMNINESDNEDLQSQLGNLLEENESLKEDIEKLNETIENLEEEIGSLKNASNV